MIRLTIHYNTRPVQNIECVCFPQDFGDFIIFVTKGSFTEWKEAQWEKQENIVRIYQNME